MSRLSFLVALLVLSAGPSLAQSHDVAAPGGAPAQSLAKPGAPPTQLGGLPILFDGGSVVNSPGGGAGGADASVLQGDLAMTSLGAGHQKNAGNFVADDFTVPAGATWSIQQMQFLAYQTGGTTATSTMRGYYVQVWNGPPGVAGSTVVVGDTTTNVFTSSTFSNIYRVSNTTQTATTRPLYRTTVTPPVPFVLTAGTYWLQWGATGTLASGPWQPPVTITGQITTGNARQLTSTGWANLLDGGTGTPQGIPFVLRGTGGAPAGPLLTATPASVAFGSVTVGTTSAATTVTLSNPGTTATTVTAIATAAPFAVTTPALPLTIAAGASSTIQVRFSPTAAGPATGAVTVTSNAPGSPTTVALTGTGAAPSPPGSYPSTDTPIAIPDNNPAGIVSTITVPAGAPAVGDLDVDLDVTHTWVGDLTMTLAHAGVTQAFFDRPGVPQTTFGCSGNDVNLVIDDEGATGNVTTNCTTAPNPTQAYTANGAYTPDAPLTVFNGLASAGAWTLTIADNGAGDTGTLNAWALIIASAVAEDGGASVASSRMVVAPNPLAGQGQIDLTVGTTQDVRVALFDALGREVRVLLDRSLAAGQQAYVGFTTAGLPAGVYVVRAVGTDVNLTQRVTVVR